MPPEAADEHGDGRDHREHRRHPQRGQLGVQVRVAGADQRPGGRVEEAGDVHQPQPEAGEQEQHRQQDGQVQARGRLDAQPSRPQHDIPAQPVEREQQEQAEPDQGGEEPDGRRERRQREDVEPDVTREDRIGDPEPGAVEEAEHEVPAGRGGQAGEQPQHQRHREAQTPERRREVQVRRRRRDPEHDRVGNQAPLPGPQVQVEHPGGQPPGPQEEQRPGGQLAGIDDLISDLAEPPPVGDQNVGGRQDEHRREDGQQQDRREAVSEHGGSRAKSLAASPGGRGSQGRSRAFDRDAPVTFAVDMWSMCKPGEKKFWYLRGVAPRPMLALRDEH